MENIFPHILLGETTFTKPFGLNCFFLNFSMAGKHNFLISWLSQKCKLVLYWSFMIFYYSSMFENQGIIRVYMDWPGCSSPWCCRQFCTVEGTAPDWTGGWAVCPGSLFPPQLAATAAHHHCMPVDRGPYSKTGTADENTEESTKQWMISMVKLCFLWQTLTQTWQQTVNIRQLFAILSHLQDVVVVVFRESALFIFTGTLTFDVDVLPIQTHRMSNA